jgi:hypothetical protein
MARIVRLSPLFHRRLEVFGARHGTPERAAVGATIAALAEARELPGLLDSAAMIPPTTHAFVRRVGGRNLWIWYRAGYDEVVIVTITRMPPTPVDA